MDSNITAKVILDAQPELGHRITTLEVTMPKFLVAQLNTHRALVKNSASSRAIPITQFIHNILESPVTPAKHNMPANSSGMVPKSHLKGIKRLLSIALWNTGIYLNLGIAYLQHKLGLHKSWANRPLEAYYYTKVLITATEWDNFFKLRLHKDAQDAMYEVAHKMRDAIDSSFPIQASTGYWYLPYVGVMLEPTQADLDISVSCCAQVSFRTLDMSPDKANRVVKALSGEPFHACYSDDTQLLTLNGWVTMDNYDGVTPIAVFNKDTKEIHFESPKMFRAYDYTSHLIAIQGQQISSFTTPNHRHLVQKRTCIGWQPLEVKTSEELFNSSYKFITSGSYLGKGVTGWDMPMSMLGFYIGDGSEQHNQVYFHLKRPRKISFLYNLDSGTEAQSSDRYKISGNYGKWVSKHCRTTDNQKKLPDDYLLMSFEQWQELKLGLLNSDGNTRRNTWVYSTTSLTLAEQIQALAHLHNESCSIVETLREAANQRSLYRLNFSKRTSPEVSISQKGRSRSYTNTLIPYQGKVYCPTVSTGFILVRHNQKIMVSGNSPFEHIAVLNYKSKGSYKDWETYRHLLENPTP